VTKTVQPVKGAGGVSAARNEIEGKVAIGLGEEHLGRHADLRFILISVFLGHVCTLLNANWLTCCFQANKKHPGKKP
jgi:hypothetical protein